MPTDSARPLASAPLAFQRSATELALADTSLPSCRKGEPLDSTSCTPPPAAFIAMATLAPVTPALKLPATSCTLALAAMMAMPPVLASRPKA